MKRRIALSPAQAASFAMGRTLLVFERWAAQTDAPVEFDRAMLIDFAVQNPRSIAGLVPIVRNIVRAYGIDESDLGDLFVLRRFSTVRESFSSAVALLISRGLVDEAPRTDKATSTLLRVTAAGQEAAWLFSTPLSLAIRSLSEALCAAWRRRNTDELRRELRDTLPDSSRDASELTMPIRLGEDD